jgi:hypothetical protein
MRYLALTAALLLTSCVTGGDGGGYVRTSGRTNPERVRLALAECQGEASASPQGFYVDGFGWAGLAGNVVARAAQEQSITSACMARHGYVQVQPRPQPQQ